MKKRLIPGTELTPSLISLGTGEFGTSIDEEQSFKLLDYYFESGGTFIDTAHVYGDWASEIKGMSERTIGKWISSRSVRDEIIIATKGGHPYLKSMDISRLSPEEIIQDIEESLECLKIDSIDLYWLHRDDPKIPVSDMIDALNGEVKRGTIRYFACSNWQPHRIMEALKYSNENHISAFVANQLLWSLAIINPGACPDPTMVIMDDESMKLHMETNMAAVAYSSQANGFFSGDYGPSINNPPRPSAKGVIEKYYNTTNFERLERAMALAYKLGRTANEVALAYLISHEFPVFPIVGCKTVDQLTHSCKASNLILSTDELRYLETL